MFQFFIHEVTLPPKTGHGLANPQGPRYSDYFYLVESLSTVKSIVLVCDLNGAEDMMIDLFQGFFEIVKCVALCHLRVQALS